MTRKRAGVYGRNSKGDNKSIKDQLRLGRAAVSRKNWLLAAEYEDDSSASIFRQKERENWAKLLADISAGLLDVVVLWKVARGSRDEIDWFPLLRTCAERRVLIHVLADDRTYDPADDRDWKTLADEGVNASYYARQLSKDVRRGVAEAAALGHPHGRAAYGYNRAYTEDKEPLRVPNELVPIVVEIFDRLAELTPINALVKDFTARGVPSPSGVGWHRNGLRRIATNPAYIGKRRAGGELVAATWPAMVDEDVFWRVQQILGAPERTTTKPGKVRHLLSYIGTTPCGAELNFRADPGRSFASARYACVRDGCVSVTARDADAVVERLILARLRRRDVRKLLVGGSTEIRRAAADLARYEGQLEEARKSFESVDGISAQALARKERMLIPLIEEARERSRPKGVPGVIEDLATAGDPRARWDALEMAARRAVVAAMANVKVGPGVLRLSRWTMPDERLREAAVRLGPSSWVGDTRTWGEI